MVYLNQAFEKYSSRNIYPFFSNIAHAWPMMMDACYLSSVKKKGFDCLKGVLDGKLESILDTLERSNYDEATKEVMANFTKSALLDSRKKIFDIVVAKKIEEASITTTGVDVNKPDPKDEEGLLCQDPGEWQMVNRRSKPRIVSDMCLLVLHTKYPREPFPLQVLKKPPEKQKIDLAEPVNNATAVAEDWTRDDPEEEIEDSVNDSATDNVEHSGPAVSKRIERFVIREVNAVNIPGDSGESVPIEVTALKDSGTSTKDLITTRTISTQTCEADTGLPITAEKSRTSNESSGKASTNPRTQSEASLFEYIDEEYETTVKNNPTDMNSTKRKQAAPAGCDKRFIELEKKYETVLKRVVSLEKTHADDINALRNELRGQPQCTHPRLDPANRTLLPKKPERNPNPEPLSSTSTENDSDWDVHGHEIMVSTQNSQGETVVTKATPVHLKEMNSTSVCKCDCKEEPRAGSRQLSKAGESTTNARTRNSRNTANRRNENEKDESVFVSDDDDFCDGKNDNKKTTERGSHDNEARNERDMAADRRELPSKRNIDEGRSMIVPNLQTVRPSKQRTSNQLDNDRGGDDNVKRRRIDAAAACEPSTSRQTSSPNARSSSAIGKSSDTNECQISNSSNNSKGSFAKIAAAGKWNEVKSGNNKDKGKKREYPSIKSASVPKNRELYVKGLSCADFKLHRDLEEAIKWYCKERGVNTVYQRVIMYNRDSDSVGMKVVVREAEVEKFMSKDFWPEGIWVREWSEDKPTGRDRFFGNDRSSSDESL